MLKNANEGQCLSSHCCLSLKPLLIGLYLAVSLLASLYAQPKPATDWTIIYVQIGWLAMSLRHCLLSPLNVSFAVSNKSITSIGTDEGQCLSSHCGLSLKCPQHTAIDHEKQAMLRWSYLVSTLSLTMVLLLNGQCLSSHCCLSHGGAADGCLCASSPTNSNTEHSRTPL